jgi:hypothetical protein
MTSLHVVSVRRSLVNIFLVVDGSGLTRSLTGDSQGWLGLVSAERRTTRKCRQLAIYVAEHGGHIRLEKLKK